MHTVGSVTNRQPATLAQHWPTNTVPVLVILALLCMLVLLTVHTVHGGGGGGGGGDGVDGAKHFFLI